METVKKILKYKVPLYFTILLMILCVTLITSCNIIPVSYVTNATQKKIVKQNTLLNIELLRRYEKMNPETRKKFLIKNAEFAIQIEEIICGEKSSASEILKKVVGENNE